jgi:hypothetical protein
MSRNGVQGPLLSAATERPAAGVQAKAALGSGGKPPSTSAGIGAGLVALAARIQQSDLVAGRTHRDCCGHLRALGPFWSMPALYLSAKAAPGGIALISALAALMIVVAVTVVAIGHHNRNRASAVPQLKVAA